MFDCEAAALAFYLPSSDCSARLFLTFIKK